MRQATSMLWKEWHELRVYLFIGLGVLVGFPMIEALERFHFARRVEFTTSPWVIMLGGVLAVFVGVGAGCRDFNGRLEDFWRSRPVGPARWMLVKYGVGLFVVLVSCMTPLALELWFHQRDSYAFNVDTGTLLAWSPFLWAALFSLAFLAGCLIQRTAQAAMLALAAMLLVYCLPLILPPLAWLSTTELFSGYRGAWEFRPWQWEWRFAEGMAGVAAGSLLLALLAVARGWRIEAGRKMMYGSISLTILILLASAAYQLGTNLPILQEINLPAGERVVQLRFFGESGYVLTERFPPGVPDNQGLFPPERRVRKFQLTASGIEMGGVSSVDESIIFGGTWTRKHPEIAYRSTRWSLDVWDLSTGKNKRLSLPGTRASPDDSSPVPYAWDNRLYVMWPNWSNPDPSMGGDVSTFDISQPMAPRLISNTRLNRFGPFLGGQDQSFASLPELPGAPPRARLEAALKSTSDSYDLEGDVVYARESKRVYAYRLEILTDTHARFEKIGEYDPPLMETLFGYRWNAGMTGGNGLLYMNYESSFSNGSVMVFDTAGNAPSRPAAHFAAPGIEVVCPLPDGRAIVGGTKLWLVGPPPRHGP